MTADVSPIKDEKNVDEEEKEIISDSTGSDEDFVPTADEENGVNIKRGKSKKIKKKVFTLGIPKQEKIEKVNLVPPKFADLLDDEENDSEELEFVEEKDESDVSIDPSQSFAQYLDELNCHSCNTSKDPDLVIIFAHFMILSK